VIFYSKNCPYLCFYQNLEKTGDKQDVIFDKEKEENDKTV
jgi:hypothetical protein